MTDPGTYLFREYGVKINESKFIRNFILRTEHEKDFVLGFKNTDIFYCLYAQCSTDRQESFIYGEFYIDIDCKDASTNAESFRKVREDAIKCVKYLINIVKVNEASIQIYFSGNKGIHITVPPEAMGVEPCANLNVIYKMLADDIYEFTPHKLVDMQIYDARRLFRIPNSKNGSTGLHKIRISYEELKELSMEEIISISKRNRIYKGVEENADNYSARNNMVMYRNRALLSQRNTYREVTKTLTSTPPCIKWLLENQVKEGQRNNTSIAIASFFKQSGYNIEEAESMMMGWGMDHCDPPLSEREIKTTLNQAYIRNYKYGCNKLRLLAECDAKNCELKG
jgi:hypothetical protein